MGFWRSGTGFGAAMLAKTKPPELPGDLAFKTNGALFFHLGQ
jgi:hypothetical protein